MTVKELKIALADKPNDWPVYFRRIAPYCGNIEEVGAVNEDIYGSFGEILDCVIIEPYKDNSD
jgi:hypothetical protein